MLVWLIVVAAIVVLGTAAGITTWQLTKKDHENPKPQPSPPQPSPTQPPPPPSPTPSPSLGQYGFLHDDKKRYLANDSGRTTQKPNLHAMLMFTANNTGATTTAIITSVYDMKYLLTNTWSVTEHTNWIVDGHILTGYSFRNGPKGDFLAIDPTASTISMSTTPFTWTFEPVLQQITTTDSMYHQMIAVNQDDRASWVVTGPSIASCKWQDPTSDYARQNKLTFKLVKTAQNTAELVSSTNKYATKGEAGTITMRDKGADTITTFPTTLRAQEPVPVAQNQWIGAAEALKKPNTPALKIVSSKTDAVQNVFFVVAP